MFLYLLKLPIYSVYLLFLQLAFDAVMLLWGHDILKHHGTNIAEKILSILCHIIKGEATIRESLEKEAVKKPASEPENRVSKMAPSSSEVTSSTLTESSRPQRDVIPVSPAYVQQVSRFVLTSSSSLVASILFYFSKMSSILSCYST